MSLASSGISALARRAATASAGAGGPGVSQDASGFGTSASDSATSEGARASHAGQQMLIALVEGEEIGAAVIEILLLE